MAPKRDSLSDIWKLKQRGRRDSNRHKELVKRAIRKHGRNLITEYDIITSDGDKKVKVPIRFLDQYKFRYGKLKKNGGTGQGLDGKPGTRYQINNSKKKSEGGKAGKEPGTKTFEAEVTIDEVVEILLEELNLPWMEPKNSDAVEVETEELSSIERVGIMPNIDLKRTLIENLKRNAAQGKGGVVGDFHENDLRYRTWEDEIVHHSNAAVYMMMDRSGSMDPERTYIAKSFYFWMVQYLRRRYKNINMYFIAHDAQAYMVEEKEFFKMSSNGGTQCSSAFKMAYEHVKANHPPESTNIYIMEFSDGDNFVEDNLVCIDYVKKLLSMATAIGYGEIATEVHPWQSEKHMLSSMFAESINRTRFVSFKISSRDQVFDALKTFFNIENISKGIKERKTKGIDVTRLRKK